MGDLIKSARLFAANHFQRITVGRDPQLQSVSSHLKSVAQMVASVSKDEETIAAAWLHDIVGDTGVTVGDLEREFGTQVAQLVGELAVINQPERDKHELRPAFAKTHFAAASAEAKTIKLADLIDTCEDLYKRHPAALRAHAAQANELVSALEGGDACLLERLKRDLKNYAAVSLPVEAVAGAPQFRPLALPVAALRVFESALTARHIAEPLISFDSNCEAKEVREAMAVARVEVAGLHTQGIIWGFVEAGSLGEGPCQTQGRPFAPGQVVASRSSLADAIETLTRHDRCFVSALGNVVGVISRSDMHGPAARMWLFGIITVAELEFTERIRQKWPNDAWVGLLPQPRMERAYQLRAQRDRRKEKCQLVDCLQLSDKMEILVSDPAELAALGILSASAARKARQQIESLRNSLAHARDFAAQDWPQVVRLARRIQQLAAES